MKTLHLMIVKAVGILLLLSTSCQAPQDELADLPQLERRQEIFVYQGTSFPITFERIAAEWQPIEDAFFQQLAPVFDLPTLHTVVSTEDERTFLYDNQEQHIQELIDAAPEAEPVLRAQSDILNLYRSGMQGEELAANIREIRLTYRLKEESNTRCQNSYADFYSNKKKGGSRMRMDGSLSTGEEEDLSQVSRGSGNWNDVISSIYVKNPNASSCGGRFTSAVYEDKDFKGKSMSMIVYPGKDLYIKNLKFKFIIWPFKSWNDRISSISNTEW
ncbi:MAG: hypothetical protein AAF587_37130 [Bacteroidota bacterium]